MTLNLWIITGLTMVATGGIVHAFIHPHLSGERLAEKRQAALRSSGPKPSADRQADAANRRKQIAETLKELGERRKQSLDARIAQAGLSWNRKKFIVASLVSAALLGGL